MKTDNSTMCDLAQYLKVRPYPGRGILLGKSPKGKAVIAYFIMGRSTNSRNRIFETTRDGIRTKAYDESKMTDPSLIIYHPVRKTDGGVHIVTNGDQTDTVRDFFAAGKTFADALATRTFEPDAPNWTPRISGIVKPDGSYALSIVKTLDGDAACACRNFFEYENPKAGCGHFISTYEGFGTPLPSFGGEPVSVKLDAENAQTLADAIWESLDEANRVSLFVRCIDLANGSEQTVLVNKNQ